MKHRACPNEKDRAKWKKYSAEEVARHDNLEDAWVIIYGRVYDITSFAITHPGWNNAGQVSTALAIVRNLGKDCTEEFEYTHSLTAWRQLNDFQVGTPFSLYLYLSLSLLKVMLDKKNSSVDFSSPSRIL